MRRGAVVIRRLKQRAEDAAGRRRRERIARIVEALEDKAGVVAEPGPSGVLLSGRALVRRWLSDPALRFAGTMAK